MWSYVLPLALLLICGTAAFMPYPWHASCLIKWQIPDSCQNVQNRLVNQFRAWQGDALCPKTTTPSCPKLPCGQKCLYDLGDVNGNVITGTHTTPVARYVDDLTFTLTNGGPASCSVEAKSSSRLWYAILDMGTNYCNLRNLVDGAGYGNGGLREVTSDSVCTQYTSRDCSRF